MTSAPFEAEISTPLGLPEICRYFHQQATPTVWLDGADSAADAWGPRLAIRPVVRRVLTHLSGMDFTSTLAGLAHLLGTRQRGLGSAETGLLVVLGYDAGAPVDFPAADVRFPDLIALEVEASVRPIAPGRLLLSATSAASAGTAQAELARLADLPNRDRVQNVHAPTPSRPRTSLPKCRYIAAVEALLRRIAAGDIYQANLTQRFDVAVSLDALTLHERVRETSPAPRAALVEIPGLALVSASPELFLRVDAAGHVETWPIKGTRARGTTPVEDLAAAEDLQASAKDQAELLMIVDVERNDLSRVCQIGSVRVPALAQLRSWRTVHHLLSIVVGQLKPEATSIDLLRAVFPGGSITGAPKLSAMRILAQVEPVRRGIYTGSLLWFGDDGSLDASILIRTIVVSGGRAWIGAGGGIVTDSDPEREWQESNAKARALTRVLGFEPEEAG